jgi:hypothetical protein
MVAAFLPRYRRSAWLKQLCFPAEHRYDGVMPDQSQLPDLADRKGSVNGLLAVSGSVEGNIIEWDGREACSCRQGVSRLFVIVVG